MSCADRCERLVWHPMVLVLLTLLTCSVGCGAPAASVIIDNTNPSTMTVKIDGKQAAKIEGRTFQTIRLMPGQYEMEVELGGRRVFKGVRTIEESTSMLAGKTYLLNPTGNTRYAICKVVYGDSIFGDLTEDAIVSLAEHYKGEKVDKTNLQYHRIKQYAEPMPGGSWFPVSGAYYILRNAPDSVYSKSSEVTRTVLTRISKDDHAALRKAHRVENPTEADLDALAHVTERALDSMSQLEPSE